MKQVYKDRTGIWRGVGDRNTVRHDSAFQDESLSARTSHVGTATGCFILNNTLLKELGVEVKGYADLLQPELKGKIAMGDPTASSSAFAELTNMLLDMGEGDTPADRYMSDAAWDYIAKFIDNIDGIVLSSSDRKSVV